MFCLFMERSNYLPCPFKLEKLYNGFLGHCMIKSGLFKEVRLYGQINKNTEGQDYSLIFVQKATHTIFKSLFL